jgi:hypothetical protein
MAMAYDLKVKTLSELKDTIFSQDNIQSIDTIENANLMSGFDLCTYYPAQYQDPNKKALFDDLIQKRKYTPSINKDILITRFDPKSLPNIYTSEQHNDKSKIYTFIPNIFNYESGDASDVINWHMNFANCDIFAYYHSNLLAQDELQVLECPVLASLREYLIHQNDSKNSNNKLFSSYVVENNVPYPILISNIERILELDTTNLYGKN